MNLAITATTARTVRRLQAHYLLAGSLALGLAVATAAGAWQVRGTGAGTVPAAAPRPLAVSAVPNEPSFIYYIAASEAQARMVSAAELDATYIRAAAGIFETPYRFEVVVATDPVESEQALREIAALSVAMVWWGLPEITVVDLRTSAD